MRHLPKRLLPVLALACGIPHPPDGAPGAQLRKGDDALTTALSASCAADPCDVLWVTVDPPGQVMWRVDGEDVGSADGLELVVELGAERVVAFEQPDGTWAEAWFSRIDDAVVEEGEDLGIDGGPEVVILGHHGQSCDTFGISTVGGCITSGSDVVFHPQAGSDTVFGTSPVPSVVQLDHGYAAWLPDGSATVIPSVVPTTVSSQALAAGPHHQGGFEYWFSVAPSVTVEITARHTWGTGAMGPRRLPIAHCSKDGVPSILEPGASSN